MIDDLWYKNAVFYCLDVGTFMDANGDGCGDFEGLLRRLDYLAGLGVTALWLQPFQPSPNHDDGYDTLDYYGVDPRHGSAGDFAEFTQQARQRGIRVIIDLVINHTSDKHPWFQAARKDENSQFRALLLLVEEEAVRRGQGDGVPRRAEDHLVLRQARRAPTTTTASIRSSPTSTPRTRRCRRRSGRSWASGCSWG